MVRAQDAEGLAGDTEHPTSNILHRTSNIQHPMVPRYAASSFDVRCSMFDVECSARRRRPQIKTQTQVPSASPHPTVERWMLDVGCWMLDVLPPPYFGRASTIPDSLGTHLYPKLNPIGSGFACAYACARSA